MIIRWKEVFSMVITLILFKLSIKLARKLQARYVQRIDLENGMFYKDCEGNSYECITQYDATYDDNELLEIKVE